MYLWREKEKRNQFSFPLYSPSNKSSKWNIFQPLTLASTLITSHSNQQERGGIKRKIQTRSTKCQDIKSIDACLLLPSSCLKTMLNNYISSCKISLPGLVSHVILFSFSLTEITLALKAWWRKRLNSISSCLIIFSLFSLVLSSMDRPRWFHEDLFSCPIESNFLKMPCKTFKSGTDSLQPRMI